MHFPALLQRVISHRIRIEKRRLGDCFNDGAAFKINDAGLSDPAVIVEYFLADM